MTFPLSCKSFLAPLISAAFVCGSIFIGPLATADAPGGFVEQPSTAVARPVYSRTQLLNLLPARGKFTFPAPYNTTAIRLTNESDCNNVDCVNHTGYSYWNNINNHAGKDTMLVFVVLDRNLGGAGPTLLQYNKVTDQVQNLGTLFDNSNPLSWSTGEGWYFSATMPTALYINSDSSLLRYDVITRTTTTVFDIKNQVGTGYYLWQAHSSTDDRVHSATVRKTGTWEMLGCVTYNESNQQFLYFPRKGAFDECQVDKSGKWLLIKEDLDGKDGEDNRIINLETQQERVLLDAAGAAGHSDMGFGYMIAADNFAAAANTQKLWKFDAATLTGIPVYHNADWNVSAPSHVSHSNAMAAIAPEKQYACGSSANRTNSAEANEIVCFGLDGSDKALVVAPVMTNLDASGGGTDYAKTPKGNLDPTGQYFIWTSNMGGPRLDYFIVKVPAQLLTSGTSTTSVTTATAADVIPPAISGISVSNITGTSAKISWTTNEAAEDMVQYGLTTSYGSSTVIDGIFSTSHTRTISSLNPGTAYHYRVVVRDAAGNVASSSDRGFTTAAVVLQPSGVTWTNIVNATAQGSTLTKTAGCDGCADAYGSSVQAITGGNGYLQFTVSDNRKMVYGGLSVAQTNTPSDQIDFALRVQSGYAEVRENGGYRAETPIATGDVLRIAVVSGVVSYSRNGTVFFKSYTPPVFPMRAYATLYSQGSSLSSVLLMGK